VHAYSSIIHHLWCGNMRQNSIEKEAVGRSILCAPESLILEIINYKCNVKECMNI
jgi:hypothetical protein